ncbi:MAG: hypothetical protein FWE31_02140 [Firmicutes bacterium]|nr:hypothetical protein [Bacillota bacterium]
MKKLLAILVMVCGVTILVGCANRYDPFQHATEADLVSSYQLAIEAFVWNDYQPVIQQPLRTNHFVEIRSPQKLSLPEIQVHVIINGNISRIFKHTSYGSPPHGDFRATELFRLQSNSNWTMAVTILIGNQRQTINLNGRVFVTH